MTSAPGFALASPILVGCGGRAGQSRPRSADEPTATGTAKADVCLVAPVLTYAQQGGLNRSAQEPHSTICASAKDQNALIGCTLVQTGYGEREGQQPRALDPERPLGTVVAGGVKHAAVAAFMAQHNTDVVGHPMTAPVSTIVGKGCTQALVEASFLSHSYTSNTRGGEGDLGKPIKTVTAGGMHAAEVRAFLSKYYGPAIGQDAQDPLHTATTKARFGLVTVEIGGEPYLVVDIGMRMLSPRELFRAQGFPDSYIIDRGMRVAGLDALWAGSPRLDDPGEAEIVPITKTAQVRMCGNSVCPPLAEALVAANFRERAEIVAPRLVDLPLFALEAAE
jgi:DNA (cytosine-5)-methyltransferase 1